MDRFRAKATKARQAQSRIKALERMELIAPAHIDSPFSFGFQAPHKNPHPLLKLEDCTAGYADNKILEDVELVLNPGDRIGLHHVECDPGMSTEEIGDAHRPLELPFPDRILPAHRSFHCSVRQVEQDETYYEKPEVTMERLLTLERVMRNEVREIMSELSE
mgnify:CR=1 FL=1